MDVDSDKKESTETSDKQDSALNVNTELQHQLEQNNGNMLTSQLSEDKDFPCSKDQEITSFDDLKTDQYRSEATFSYAVEYAKLIKYQTQYSPAVYVRLLPWKIMVLPNIRALGFFLQCRGDIDWTAWSCKAYAELRIKCHKPDAPPYTRTRIKHIFCTKDKDYGYANFISWQDLIDPEKCLVNNECVTFEVHIVADIPRGIMWDSKKYTGYVGLKNQGATCYMNSILQTLFFTNQLRKAVYKIPTEADDSSDSVGLSLQRIFYELQSGDYPVGTKILTKSFGWEALDSFMQHDVQEFLRILLDKLETTMNNTSLEGTMRRLFEGKMSSYIKCKNVDYNSIRYETFYDIQLNIKDKKDIFESFKEYIASENLNGDNKYDAGLYGLQEASKGVIFTAFPPVLHLHLMRFQYDPITDNSIKYNDRFEFYEQINLDQFLLEKEKTPADYVLHAVLVHSGDNNGGHYVVFINPKADGQWFKFNDDLVSSCSKTEAIEQNYGGMDDKISFQPKCSNAYMLVYIRLSELSNVLANITKEDIPYELLERLDEVERIEVSKIKYFIEAELYITINILTEDVFELHQRQKLFDPEDVFHHIIKVKQTATVDEMMNIISKACCTPKNRMRIWTVFLSQGRNQKMAFYDIEHDGYRALESITTRYKPWSIFLEIAPPDVPLTMSQTFDAKKDIFMFIKFYDALNNSLNYIGCAQLPLDKVIWDIIVEVNAKLGFDLATKLKIYDEYTKKYIINIKEPLKNILDLSDNLQGYILVFEKDYTKTNMDVPTVKDYFLDVMFRTEVIFLDKSNPNEPEIILEMPNRYTYDQMVQAISVRINTDFDKIQFFTCVSNLKDSPGTAIPYLFKGTIEELLNDGKKGRSKKIYYQRLSLSIHELDNNKEFKCVWVSNDLKEEKELVLYINKNDYVKELLEEAAEKIQFSENSQKQLRLLKVSNHKIVAIIEQNVSFETLQKSYEPMIPCNPQKTFRIEEIPTEDLQLTENEMLIPVTHFSKELYNAFGVPFLIKAANGETYGTLKQRIQTRLNVTDKEWETYKLTVISMGRMVDMNDDSLIELNMFKAYRNVITSCFALEHKQD
ncbi:ubiquitin carboxyl-terminal hydrolase 7-like [Teleopsis dalmanni]|uniref:ubiquitin carboxyl-terminal hydrolase 7-like n=1 Tax=Teleopsis dalmanni TaxID=139649 RepID=UPI0018CD91F6|nr:ubiquitin carboxyl-terminal hydrolase 7-like [Teleopsis dalmanni]